MILFGDVEDVKDFFFIWNIFKKKKLKIEKILKNPQKFSQN